MQAFLVHTSAFALHWWNLSNNVGMGSPNNPDDVQLAQFGFFCMGLPTSSTTQSRTVYARVRPGAAYTTAANDPLTVAIATLELQLNAVQPEHRVNPFPDRGYSYQDSTGRHIYLLGYLMNSIYDAVGLANWPRLDRHAN